MKRPKGTVKSLLSRGKKMLRNAMEQKDVESESSNQPEVETRQETLRIEVTARVDELPDRYRQPIYLKYVEHLTYPEISRQLNLSEGTVKSLVSRGKKMLFGEQTQSSK